MRSHLITLNFYFQGEPYLHPKFLDMVENASSKRSLREIWHSGAYHTFRSSVLTVRRKIDICRNCTEGMESRI